MNSEPECEELTEEGVIVEALTRSRRENRPCEFVLPATLQKPMRQRWAWPDGTVSEPDLERWNSLKYLRGLANKRNGVAPGAA